MYYTDTTTSRVGKMLDTLEWTSLEERRKQQRLAMLYKIQHGQVALNISDYLKPAPRISQHSHELAFQVPSTSVDYIKFSFSSTYGQRLELATI